MQLLQQKRSAAAGDGQRCSVHVQQHCHAVAAQTQTQMQHMHTSKRGMLTASARHPTEPHAAGDTLFSATPQLESSQQTERRQTAAVCTHSLQKGPWSAVPAWLGWLSLLSRAAAQGEHKRKQRGRHTKRKTGQVRASSVAHECCNHV